MSEPNFINNQGPEPKPNRRTECPPLSNQFGTAPHHARDLVNHEPDSLPVREVGLRLHTWDVRPRGRSGAGAGACTYETPAVLASASAGPPVGAVPHTVAMLSAPTMSRERGTKATADDTRQRQLISALTELRRDVMRPPLSGCRAGSASRKVASRRA